LLEWASAKSRTSWSRGSRYDDWLRQRYDAKEEYEDRNRNVNELLNAIADFGRTHRRASVAEYLESISLYTQADDMKSDNACG
jgi:superfamily I DNA/RNA helicase